MVQWPYLLGNNIPGVLNRSFTSKPIVELLKNTVYTPIQTLQFIISKIIFNRAVKLTSIFTANEEYIVYFLGKSFIILLWPHYRMTYTEIPLHYIFNIMWERWIEKEGEVRLIENLLRARHVLVAYTGYPFELSQ